MGHGGVAGFEDVDRSLLLLGVAEKVGAGQFVVPGPVVLGVGGGVDAHPVAPGLHEAAQFDLLLAIQNITRRIQEDDEVVLLQILLGEDGSVLGRIDAEALLLPQAQEHLFTVGDARVTEAGRFGEHERATHFRLTASAAESQEEDDGKNEDVHRGVQINPLVIHDRNVVLDRRA